MTENMPFIANPCMVMITSLKDGLTVPAPPVDAPPAAALRAETPVITSAAPAMAAATYDTAATATVFPFVTEEVMHATSSPVSKLFSCNVA